MINHSVDVGGTAATVVTGDSRIEVIDVTLLPSSVSLSDITYKSLVGPDDVIYLGVSKLLEFKVPVPENYHGGLQLLLTNQAFDLDDYIVDICQMKIVDVGSNLPCLHPTDGIVVADTPEEREVNGYSSLEG